MSGVLVLGTDHHARSWRQRIAKARSRRKGERSARANERPEAIVIVDHSPDAILNLRRARALQAQRPDLQIAVLRIIDARENPTMLELVAASAPKPPPPRSADLSQTYPELSLDVRDGMLTYEYSGN